MGLLELFVAVLIAGISIVNVGAPVTAWSRARDDRFLLLIGANAGLAAVGLVWVWGQLPVDPPSYSEAGLPVLGLALVAVVLFLAAAVWPRRM